MILSKKNSYLGLDRIPIYIEDITPASLEYLDLEPATLATLTSGKNLLKIKGSAKFKPGTNFYVEVLDANNNVVYSEISNYYDTLKRRVIIIEVNSTTAPGFGTITIVGCLKDEYVPIQFRNKINFKWKKKIKISPFELNSSQIIFETPPIVSIESKLKPIVESVYRNSYYLISNYGIGTVSYLNTGIEDYTGDHDSSYNILQPNEIIKLLGTYTSGSVTGSITSFGSRQLNKIATKDTVYYSTINRNSPVLTFNGYELNSSMNGARIYIENPLNITPNTGSGWTPISSLFESYIEKVENSNTVKLFIPYILHLTNSINNQKQLKINAFDNSKFVIQYNNNKIPTAIPNITSSDAVYEVLNAYLDLHIWNLTPLSGDVARIKIYALESNKPGEYQELDSYALNVVDTLMDTNYNNHISYVASPYRLVGYFTPTLLQITSSIYDSASFAVKQFTASLWTNTNNSSGTIGVSSSIFNITGSNGSCSFNAGTASFSGSNIPSRKVGIIAFSGSTDAGWYSLPVHDTGSITYQVTYDVLTNMNTDAEKVNIIPILMTASINFNSSGNIYITGSNYLDVGKDLYRIPNPSNSTGSFMSYITVGPNTSSILGMYFYSGISSAVNISASIGSITVTEIGNTNEILNKYWTIGSASVAIPMTSSAKLPLMDSVYISSSVALNNGSTNNEYFTFQTRNYYKFWENTTYVIRFNAIGRSDSTSKRPKIIIWGQNSGSLGAPFKYVPNNFGYYIGEIQNNFDEPFKLYDQVEMLFTAQSTGMAQIVFQICNGIWNISEISIKEYDPIGFTPNHVRFLAKIPGNPGDYEGIVLSFKIEYYNSKGEQSEYVTYVNDIKLTNLNPIRLITTSPNIVDAFGLDVIGSNTIEPAPPPDISANTSSSIDL